MLTVDVSTGTSRRLVTGMDLGAAMWCHQGCSRGLVGLAATPARRAARAARAATASFGDASMARGGGDLWRRVVQVGLLSRA